MSVVTGKARWAKLLKPSKEEGPFKSKYSIDLFVDDKTAEKLKAEGIEPKYTKELKEEYFQFWTHGKNQKTGELNPQVRVVDRTGLKIEEEVGNGSIVKVQYNAVDWEFLKKKGVFGALAAVQVLTLVSRNVDEFEYAKESTDEFEDDVPF